MRAKFLSFSSNRNQECRHGAVEIVDRFNVTILPPFCEEEIPNDNDYNLDNEGTINVFNQHWKEGDLLVFDLLITAVRFKEVSKKCPDDYFNCEEDEGTCVPITVRCNGFDDCEKGLDEEYCSEEKRCNSDKTWMIVAIAAVVLFVVSAFVFGIVLVFCSEIECPDSMECCIGDHHFMCCKSCC